jgi:large subunit ribosomal protein L25
MELKASKREITGKATRRLRRQGLLPAVLYGEHSEPTTVEVAMHDFERVYARSGRTQLVDLVVERGRPHKVLIKDVQVSPRYNTFLHVDFHQVSLRERLQVEVPVSVVGDTELVRAGEADVLQVLQSLRVECIPTRIPEVIEIDISGLTEIDAAVRLADLRLPEGVSVVGDPEDVVVKLAGRRVVVEGGEEVPTADAAAEGEAAGGDSGQGG